MKQTTPLRRSDWLVPALLIVLSLVPAVAGTSRLAQLAGDAEVTPANARFFAQPIPVVLHILAVIPYSLVGAFQFSPGFRRRNRPWHRRAGRVIGVCGLVAALSGLWMAHFYPWPEGDGVGVYVERLVFGTAMLVSIVLGLDAVRRRDFKSHGAWMTRAYAIGMGAGTQVLTHLPWFILVGKPGESARTLLMGAAWVINVVVAEWTIRRQRGAEARTGTPSLKTDFGPIKSNGRASGSPSKSTKSARLPGSMAPYSEPWPMFVADSSVAMRNTSAMEIPASCNNNISESTDLPGSGVSVPMLRRTPAS